MRPFYCLMCLVAGSGYVVIPVEMPEARADDDLVPATQANAGTEGAAPTAVPDKKANLHKILDQSAARYSIYIGDERGEPLKLECVLRWANLTRGCVDGATYIWTWHGRPMASVCVYPFGGNLCDNFQSLSEEPVRAVVDGRDVWRCDKPGLEYRSVSDAPLPERSASARLRQMKSLAGRFSTTLMGWNAENSDREPLRRLPTPVYRHDDGESLDVAIFAFVQGTDPEAFLLLEAQLGSTDKKQEAGWRYAMARRTSGWLQTKYNAELVWEAERLADYSDPKQPWFQFSRPLAPLEAAASAAIGSEP